MLPTTAVVLSVTDQIPNGESSAWTTRWRHTSGAREVGDSVPIEAKLGPREMVISEGFVVASLKKKERIGNRPTVRMRPQTGHLICKR